MAIEMLSINTIIHVVLTKCVDGKPRCYLKGIRVEHFRPKIVPQRSSADVQAGCGVRSRLQSINLHNCTIDTPIMPVRMTLF